MQSQKYLAKFITTLNIIIYIKITFNNESIAISRENTQDVTSEIDLCDKNLISIIDPYASMAG